MDKAEEISDGGSISVITYLIRGKKRTVQQQQSEERSENIQVKQLCRHQGQ